MYRGASNTTKTLTCFVIPLFSFRFSRKFISVFERTDDDDAKPRIDHLARFSWGHADDSKVYCHKKIVARPKITPTHFRVNAFLLCLLRMYILNPSVSSCQKVAAMPMFGLLKVI